MPNQRTSRLAHVLAVPILAAAVGACDVEWGGAELSLDRPPTPADTATVPDTGARDLPELPASPLLYRVESDGAGEARVTPIAAIRDGGLDILALPENAPPPWWRRFDSTFLVPGRELELHAGGARAGSVVLTSVADSSGPRCPGSAAARLLLPPGRPVPRGAFAIPLSTSGAGPAPGAAGPDPSSRQKVFGPILAERLLEEAGVDRHYLARNVDLHAVNLGDTVPGMAATYLISDSLAPGPPAGNSVSLFFLARPDDDGYTPEWSRVVRYDDAAGKEAYRHVESLRLADGRVDLLRRYEGGRSRLVAAWIPEGQEERGILWTESEACPSPASPASPVPSGGEAP